jgi:tetratricopeptide (TPR) repeat protein
VAPALGDLDPKEQKAAFDLLDAAIEPALAEALKADAARRDLTELTATQLLQRKAEALSALGRDEDAIATYQRILDAFPTGHAASQCERAIKMLLGAENSTSHEARELWAKAMKDGCVNDMDIRRSAPHVVTLRMQRQGLAALAPLAAELEKACKPQGRMRSVFASVYHDLASSAARHEDCDAYRAWSVKYLDVGGSVSELMAYHKNYTPWCELQDVTRSVLWFFARLDENWEFELDHNLVSFLSHDGKKLTLTGSHDGAPSYTLDLVLEATGPGAFTCQSARWQRPKEKTQSGTCTVTLTKIAREKDDYDEGTFSATFIEEEGDRHFKQELGNGKFRLRRQ